MNEEREDRIRRQREFYTTCGEILEIEHDYQIPYARKTRWNDRKPGNGRYEGFGTIRRFSETLISITSRTTGRKLLYSEQAVFDYLREIKNSH